MLRIGVLQTCSGIDPATNAVMLVDGIAELANRGAAIVFTPEMSGLLDRNRTRAAANIVYENNDIALAAVRRAAARHGVWVQLGSLALRSENDGKLVNRAFLIDADGEIVARYDKIHLFDVTLPKGETYHESAAYRAGDCAVVAATPWGGLGLTVCYDVRFPRLYSHLASSFADMIAVPAAFTRLTGEAHWQTLLRARAIETGAFIVAAAQTGDHADGRTTFGHSLVVDPWGSVLLDLGVEPGGAVVDLDLDLVATTRARIPSLAAAREFTAALTPAVSDRSQQEHAPVAQPDRATVS